MKRLGLLPIKGIGNPVMYSPLEIKESPQYFP